MSATGGGLNAGEGVSQGMLMGVVGVSCLVVLSFFKEENTLCKVLKFCTSVDKVPCLGGMTSFETGGLLLSSKGFSFKGC